MQHITTLKTLYSVQVGLGFFITMFGTMLTAIMSTDAPSSTSSDAFLGGMMGFAFTFFPLVVLPVVASKELDAYHTKRKLWYNYIESFILFFFFFPAAIWQIYVLYQIKTGNNATNTAQQLKTKEKKYDTTDSASLNGIYITVGIILFFTASHYLEKFGEKEREIILDCGEDYISTRMFSSTKLYFNNKSSVYFTPHNAHNLGVLEGKIIRVTNPYLDTKKIDIVRSCIEQNGTYRLELPSNYHTK